MPCLSFSVVEMLPWVINGINPYQRLFDEDEVFTRFSTINFNDDRIKRQTIRKNNGDRSMYRNVKPGSQFYMHWKQRTLERFKLGVTTCKSRESILIYPDDVIINDRSLACNQIDELAYADGFTGGDDFFEFFKSGDVFSGYLLKWR